MEERVKVRLIHALIQLSPYYLYMCLLLFVLSNQLSIYFLYGLMNIFSIFLFISFIAIETIYAAFNDGQSLSEYLSQCYFAMENSRTSNQLFRLAILEGLFPLLLTWFFHGYGYILYIVIDEGVRLLNSKHRSLIEMVMNGKLVNDEVVYKQNQDEEY